MSCLILPTELEDLGQTEGVVEVESVVRLGNANAPVWYLLTAPTRTVRSDCVVNPTSSLGVQTVKVRFTTARLCQA